MIDFETFKIQFKNICDITTGCVVFECHTCSKKIFWLEGTFEKAYELLCSCDTMIIRASTDDEIDDD